MNTALRTILVSSALVVAACGTTEDGDSGKSGAAADEAITVTDAAGRTVELDEPAKKIVTLEWSETETVLSLGLDLVGTADPQQFAVWDAAEPLPEGVKDVGLRSEVSAETIAALEPDLVILEAVDDPATVKQLEKVVPVLVTQGSDAADGDLDRLRDDVNLIAQATGTQKQAKQLLSDMDTSLQEARGKVQDAGAEGKPFVMMDGSKEGSVVNVRMFAQGSLASEVGEEIGLKNVWAKKGDEDWGLHTTDVEALTAVKDEDVHAFYSASNEDAFGAGMKGNRVWEGLPFVKKGNTTRFEKGTWPFGGPKSVESMANQMSGALTQ